MKPNIHPEYKDVKIICSCGSTFVTRSTLDSDHLNLEVCAACHPFYTGTQKIMDTAGRVDRFRQKYGARSGKNEETKVEAKTETKAETETQVETKVEAKPVEAKKEVKKPAVKKEVKKESKKADSKK